MSFFYDLLIFGIFINVDEYRRLYGTTTTTTPRKPPTHGEEEDDSEVIPAAS